MINSEPSTSSRAAPATRPAGQRPGEGKARVFVSYSRKDSEFATWLRGALAEHGIEVFLDIEDTLPGEEWWRRLQELIGQTDTVIFVLSRNSLASSVCRDEVAHALKLNKRIFPAVIADIDWASAPDGLAKIHSVYFDDVAKRDAALGQLVGALETDIVWIREHTRLGELAHHWDTHGRRSADLLRRRALDDAELWLTQRPKTARSPTNLHQEYIQASRIAARKWMRLAVAGSVGIAIAMAGVGAVAYLQKLEAEQQRAEAERRKLEAEQNAMMLSLENSRMLTEFANQNLRDGDPLTAILLAAEALPDRAENSERPYYPSAELSLRTALRARRERLVLGGGPFIVRAAVFSPDGKHILIAKNDGNALIWDAATGKLVATLAGTRLRGVRTAAYSPDGKRILTGDDDGVARLWDAETGVLLRAMQAAAKSLRVTIFNHDGTSILTAGLDNSPAVWDGATGDPKFRLVGHSQGIEGAAFSRDGRRIVTASQDTTARVWDAQTGRPLATLAGHEDKVATAFFSPDGQRVLTASEDKTARLWDAESGSKLDVLLGHEAAVLFAAFSPDGRRIITTSRDKTARLWDSQIGRGAGEGARTRTLVGHTDDVQRAAFSDDGRLVVTIANDQSARIWQVDTGAPVAVLKGHQALISSVVFSPDGKTVLTASEDNTARTWDVEPKRDYIALGNHSDKVVFATFSADGKRLVTVSENKAFIWNGLTGEAGGELVGHEEDIVSAALSPDGKRVVTASRDETARIWDADTARELHTLKVGSRVNSAIFSADGRSILTASKGGTTTLWDSSTGTKTGEFLSDKSEVFGARFSPDGRRVVTASANRTARIWDVTTGKEIVLAGHARECRTAEFSPDGSQVVTAGDTTARLWNGATGAPGRVFDTKELRDEARGASVHSAAFAPDGRTVVLVIARRPYVYLWNVEDGNAYELWHKEPVAQAMFSSNGQRIVTASDDGIARLWDVETRATIDELKGHEKPVLHAVASPDGRRIVTASADATARVWNSFESTQALMDFAKRESPRCLTPEQRSQKFGLGDTPPAWCRRLQKWPYNRN